MDASQAYSLVVTGGAVSAGSSCVACSPVVENAPTGNVGHSLGTSVRRMPAGLARLVLSCATDMCVQAMCSRASGKLTLARTRLRSRSRRSTSAWLATASVSATNCRYVARDHRTALEAPRLGSDTSVRACVWFQIFDGGSEIWHACGDATPGPVTLEAGKIVVKITSGPESVPGQPHTFALSYTGLTGSLGFTIAIVGLSIMLFVVTVPLCVFCYLHRGDANSPIVRHFSKRQMSTGSNRVRVANSNGSSAATLPRVAEGSPPHEHGSTVAPAASLAPSVHGPAVGTTSWGARAISVGVGGVTPATPVGGEASTTSGAPVNGQLFGRGAPAAGAGASAWRARAQSDER